MTTFPAVNSALALTTNPVDLILAAAIGLALVVWIVGGAYGAWD